MLNTSKKGNINIGIDIGASNLKLLIIAAQKNKPQLLAHGILPVKNENELKNFLKENKINSANVRVNLKPLTYKLKDIELPQIPENEIIEAIKWQIKDHLEGDMEDYTFRYLKISSTQGAPVAKQNLVVFAVKTDLLSQQKKLLKSLHIRYTILEPDVSALRFSCLSSLEKDSMEPHAFLDIGSDNCFFAVIRNEDILFYRDIPSISGSSITKNIANDLNIAFDEAENLKTSFKINQPSNTADGESIKLRNSISNFLSKISIELQRSLDAFSLTKNDAYPAIKELHIIGGGIQLSGIEEYLEKTLGLKIIKFNPFSGLDTSNVDINNLAGREHMFAVACGLAL